MFLFWMGLSGETGFVLVGSGIIASLITAWLSADLFLGHASLKTVFVGLFRFLLYIPWLLWQIAVSNLDLVYRTLHPSLPIDPRVITFPNECRTDVGTAILGNSITLTPGTVTIFADSDTFTIHALDLKQAEGVLSGEMMRKVLAIEGTVEETEGDGGRA